MQKRKNIAKISGYNLIQVDVQGDNGRVIRTSYEVLEPTEESIGRFGSLKEAQSFIKLLCHLN